MTAVDEMMSDSQFRALKVAEQFLFREARALDNRDYEAWLGMLTDDMSYVVRAQQMRDAEAKALTYTLIDEAGASLRSRINQMSTARLSRAENPPSLTRRLISNVEVVAADAGGELNVISYVMAYRARGTIPQGGFYVGQRSDLMRIAADGLRLERREVLLDHAILFDGALTTIL